MSLKGSRFSDAYLVGRIDMPSPVHFVSGLPRSGSTLLSALLRQNPRFIAAMTSPVASLCGALSHQMSAATEFGVCFDDARRAAVLRGVFRAYYGDRAQDRSVVFDTNRSWTAKMSLIATLYPDARVICCVRDIGWIIDSIERMLNKNPLQLSRVFNFKPGSSVYARTDILMNGESGLIGQAWSSLREAWFGENAWRLIVIPYENLAKHPTQTLQKLYSELGEPAFDHDIRHVDFDDVRYDESIGMPGLHAVRQSVEYRPRKPIIPPDVFTKYNDASFWQRDELNYNGITIL